MNARIPQDIDLEDRLIYGLSPLRVVYLVLAVLGAIAIGRTLAVPVPVRAVPCLLLVAAGAGLAWGRWRGRPVDRWLLDAAVFVWRHYRPGWPRRSRPRGEDGRDAEGGQPVILRLTAINALPPPPAPPPGADGHASDLPPAA
jgi:hypothetical protein